MSLTYRIYMLNIISFVKHSANNRLKRKFNNFLGRIFKIIVILLIILFYVINILRKIRNTFNAIQ